MINIVSVRWDFDDGYVKDSNLVTLLLMWAHCSYVLECIMLFLLCVSLVFFVAWCSCVL